MTVHPTPFVPSEPVPLVRQTTRAAPYPVHALGPLRRAVEAIHDMTQAPPAICAQSILGVASLATQGLYDAETLHGRAPSSLYLMTVAASGERKSACDTLAMRSVRSFELELSDEWRSLINSYRNRKDIWDAERRRILNAKYEREEEREPDLHALGPEPEEPLHGTIVSAEPTFEGITKNMPVLRAALGIFSDEGGAFIGGYGMSNDNRLKTIAGLSSLWDGSTVTRLRAGDGVASFRGRRLALHLMLQPVVATNLLADQVASGQGFLARVLICEPESAIGTRTRIGHDPYSDFALQCFEETIGGLLRRELPLREGTRNELDPPLLPLSDEAREALSAFHLETEKAQIPGGRFDGVRPFASKAAEHAARLAAVMTIVAEQDSVSGETMKGAVELIGFYLDEAVRMKDAAMISQETDAAERMRLWLLRSWTEDCISAGDAAQRGPFKETAAAKKALQLLERHGWLIPLEDGAEVLGKRRLEAWKVVRHPA